LSTLSLPFFPFHITNIETIQYYATHNTIYFKVVGSAVDVYISQKSMPVTISEENSKKKEFK
jgi:ribosomal protein S19